MISMRVKTQLRHICYTVAMLFDVWLTVLIVSHIAVHGATWFNVVVLGAVVHLLAHDYRQRDRLWR